MADTNVGTLTLGIDIEVGSSISKQIEGVSNKIAEKLKRKKKKEKRNKKSTLKKKF